MKAITLHQPYASLIADGTKTIETRSWAPPRSLIGQRIAIHAAQKNDATVRKACSALVPGADITEFDPYVPTYLSVYRKDSGYSPLLTRIARLPLGAVVATAYLADYGQVKYRGSGGQLSVYWNEAKIHLPPYPDPYGDFSDGRWLWQLADVFRLNPPIPANGRQGFWNWEAP